MEFDKDLAARQEARSAARQAQIAQQKLAAMPQEALDAIVEAVAKAFAAEAAALAEMAVKETGFGENMSEAIQIGSTTDPKQSLQSKRRLLSIKLRQKSLKPSNLN